MGNKNENAFQYDILEEPMVLFPDVLDALLNLGKYSSDAIALYILAHFTSNYQSNERFNNQYISKYFNWGEAKINIYKKILEDMNIMKKTENDDYEMIN